MLKHTDTHSACTWHARTHACSHTQIERWGHAECSAVKMTWSLFVTMVTVTGAGVPLWDRQAVEGAGRDAAAVQRASADEAAGAQHGVWPSPGCGQRPGEIQQLPLLQPGYGEWGLTIRLDMSMCYACLRTAIRMYMSMCYACLRTAIRMYMSMHYASPGTAIRMYMSMHCISPGTAIRMYMSMHCASPGTAIRMYMSMHCASPGTAIRMYMSMHCASPGTAIRMYMSMHCASPGTAIRMYMSMHCASPGTAIRMYMSMHCASPASCLQSSDPGGGGGGKELRWMFWTPRS